VKKRMPRKIRVMEGKTLQKVRKERSEELGNGRGDK
jgi:hypothetical protein